MTTLKARSLYFKNYFLIINFVGMSFFGIEFHSESKTYFT